MPNLPIRFYHAAGGVVCDDAGRVLLLERDLLREGVAVHEIRLPKGHIEPGETAEQAARREVCEESGYCGVEIVGDLGVALTEFLLKEEQVCRVEHYFLMRLVHPDRQPPQPVSPTADEALFQPLWAADLRQAEALLTFPSEREFARRAQTLGTPPARPQPSSPPAPPPGPLDHM